MKQQFSMSTLKIYLIRIDKFIFFPFYDQFIRALESECLDSCETLLDIDCGSHSPIQRFSKRRKYPVRVDSFGPAVEESMRLKIHSEYKWMDWRKLSQEYKDKLFDYVCALDFIEHLSKKYGLELISFLERIAGKKEIVSTTNGSLPQDIYYSNPLQMHRSRLDSNEMEKMRYRVIGANGWKPLRVELSIIKWRPRLLWSRFSQRSQLLVANRPSIAFGILCIKEFR